MRSMSSNAQTIQEVLSSLGTIWSICFVTLQYSLLLLQESP